MNTIETMIRDCRADTILDTGCGCGAFTKEIAAFTPSITAIEPFDALIRRALRENARDNIRYLCMDGRAMGFGERTFDLVFARFALHHMQNWQAMVHEMIRVSRRWVLLSEPFDDPRSDAKRTTLRLWNEMLKLHSEIQYSHYPHFTVDAMESFVKWLGKPYKKVIEWVDETHPCDEFFTNFRTFAERSAKKDEWIQHIDRMQNELNGVEMSSHDRMFFLIEV